MTRHWSRVRAGRWVLVAAAALIGIAGCGSGKSSSPTSPQSGDPAVNARAGDMLDRWGQALVPILLTVKQRSDAHRAGNRAAEGRLTQTIYDELGPVLRWGRSARKAFVASGSTPVARATTAAGDAWARWASMLHTKGAIGPPQASRIADQTGVALLRTQAAYQLAGRELPPVFQTSSGR